MQLELYVCGIQKEKNLTEMYCVVGDNSGFIYPKINFSVDRKKGLKIGETYTNDHQAKEFIHYIAEDESRKMRARLSDGKFILVMSDGSLDSAVMEEEIVYVRSASDGKVKADFVGVKAVSKPDATNIAEAVCSIMDSEVSTDWKNKLVALTIDGASVMTGVNNGVVTKLRADRPYVLGIHCMAHKLELAFSDGIRKNVMARKVAFENV